MLQIIITIGIIVLAVAASVWLILRKVKQLKKPDPCRNCGSACGDCALYKELEKKKRK